MVTIEEYLEAVLEDFQDYLEPNPFLCDLKSINFSAGQLPDYNDINIQQLYLLRYAFAYAFEYKTMYLELFKRQRFSENIKITSFGCGSMIDYWSLAQALSQICRTDCKIIYQGIDLIDWNYKIIGRKQDFLNFINGNIVDALDHSDKLSADVYFFPKSISEFSDRDFEYLCSCFRDKVIVKDKVHILISVRSDEGSMVRDMEKSNRIISALTANGFITKDKSDQYWYINTKSKGDKHGIRAYDFEFVYPDGAKEVISDLNTFCGMFQLLGENCKDDCKKMLTRYPVLKVDAIKYQILSFERWVE